MRHDERDVGVTDVGSPKIAARAGPEVMFCVNTVPGGKVSAWIADALARRAATAPETLYPGGGWDAVREVPTRPHACSQRFANLRGHEPGATTPDDSGVTPRR
ncbi:MAG: hypothetical protein ACRENE_22580 [Polyangiaceae bacterium]